MKEMENKADTKFDSGISVGLGNNVKKEFKDSGDKIALVGNPNVGKSVIFNCLTGQYVVVSNYPGTTVDISSGMLIGSGGDKIEIVDTPGTNSLIPRSEDEEVARDIIFNGTIKKVIQVADYKNLKRALLITLELIEANVSLILNLNMEDEAEERGIFIDKHRLSLALGGITVLSTSATTKKGINSIFQSISSFKHGKVKIQYHDEVVKACVKLQKLMPADYKYSHSVALMLLSGDESALNLFEPQVKSLLKAHLGHYDKTQINNFAKSIFDTREKIISEIIADCYTSTMREKNDSIRYKFGLLLTDVKIGTFLFIITLAVLYLFVGYFGAGVCVNFIEKNIFEAKINPVIASLFGKYFGAESIVFKMFVGQYGLWSMGMTYAIAIVMPIMVTFFLAFGFLEDSGYLPRLTVLSDRIFKHIGLNGKAILPMILGLGCGTMAILTTRILDSKKERLIATILLALGVPCSAQLGVMMGLGAKVSFLGAALVFGAVALQVIIAGKLSSWLIKGSISSFIMELPPIRLPQFWNIVKKTYNRVIWFIKEAVPLFLAGTFILFILNETGLLVKLEAAASPFIVGLLGLPKEATFAFLMGFLRRDYGAAGLYLLAEKGMLNPVQIMVSLVTITLFVPCIASFFVMIKERGVKTAFLILGIITPYAFFVGYIFRLFLQALPISFGR
ncbi:MAG: ferrous iron transport protein B [Candidatus Wallbacteria bacterium]